jgi:drug/metabolite transporter (DMT)-like permease
MAFSLHNNALIALASAASWGGGDFSGGMAVKAATSPGDTTAGALRVVILAHATSLAVLVAILWLRHAAWPHGALLAWGLAGGGAAALSLTAFYIALSRGSMGAAAAISGLLAAAIPAVVSSVLEGAPSAVRLIGFALAAAAIWLIASGPAGDAADRRAQRITTALAIVGGLGFGFYFVALRMDNSLGVLEPLALCRAAGLVTSLLVLLALQARGARQGRTVTWSLSKTALFWALGVALLDTGGNLLFVLATRMGRLDVAAVLASLYPAGTILLAGWLLRERPTKQQFAGMAVALAAVVMVTI